MQLIDTKNKIYLLENNNFEFPTLDMMGGDIVAIGGDFAIPRLINAYKNGIFPWFIDEYNYIHWYSPKKRMVLKPNEFRLTKSLKRVIRNKGFEIKSNQNFENVIKNCATIKRKHEDSSWIDENFIEAYTYLHKLGIAHSVECYLDNELVGGLYGLIINNVFCGESMFSKVSNASKVCFYHLCNSAKENNIKLIDAQVYNEHLATLGAYEIDRSEYFRILSQK